MKKLLIGLINLVLLAGCSKNSRDIIPVVKNRPEYPFSNVIGETFVKSNSETHVKQNFSDEHVVLKPISGNLVKTFTAFTQKSSNFREEVGEKYENMLEDNHNAKDYAVEKEISYEYLGDTPFFFTRVNDLGKDDKRILDGNADMWLPMHYFDKEGTMRTIFLGRLLFVFDVGVEESKTREKSAMTNGPMNYLELHYPELIEHGPGLINARGEQDLAIYARIVLEEAAKFLMKDQERMDEFMNMDIGDYQEVFELYEHYTEVNTLSYFPYDKETYEEIYQRLISNE